MPANVLALAAIVLWGTLAWLGVRLRGMPPFLLVGSALTIAGLLASPTWRQWRVPVRVWVVGVFGLFGFHFFLFVALRLAPPLQANLINYLWPLLIVLLAPLFLRDVRLLQRHLLGAAMGFAGAVVAISGGDLAMPALGSASVGWGYVAALTSAIIWATYSLTSQRFRQGGTVFPTAAIGASCLVSGLLSLACHAVLEPPYAFSANDVLPLAALAIGPMGAAFFLWDAALRTGDARSIGTLAYLTPVLSTTLLGLDDPARLGWPVVTALLLVIGGAVVGTRRGAASASSAE